MSTSIHYFPYNKVGEHVHLECDFEEGGDQLYSVKWYKDNMEFYRSAL